MMAVRGVTVEVEGTTVAVLLARLIM